MAGNLRKITDLDVFKNAETINMIGYSLFNIEGLMFLRMEEFNAGLPQKIATLTNVDLHGNNMFLITRDNWSNNHAYSRHFFEWDFDDLIDRIGKDLKDINLEEEIRLANTLPHLPSLANNRQGPSPSVK